MDTSLKCLPLLLVITLFGAPARAQTVVPAASDSAEQIAEGVAIEHAIEAERRLHVEQVTRRQTIELRVRRLEASTRRHGNVAGPVLLGLAAGLPPLLTWVIGSAVGRVTSNLQCWGGLLCEVRGDVPPEAWIVAGSLSGAMLVAAAVWLGVAVASRDDHDEELVRLRRELEQLPTASVTSHGATVSWTTRF